MSEWKGKTALITGASYGIGEAFARRLATDNANLILTARSVDRLNALAEKLHSDHGVKVDVIAADLADPSAPQEIFRETGRRGLTVDLLINNAGFGAAADFVDLPLARELEMIQVNVTALVALTHFYLPAMIERRSGAIIQLSSTAAFQGLPYMANYAATKAFILNFSEGLWSECRGFGVRVMALCPGATATNFQLVAGTSPFRNPQKMRTSEEVVEAGLNALAQGRSFVVSGTNNKLMVFAERFFPRQVITGMAAKLFRPFSTRTK